MADVDIFPNEYVPNAQGVPYHRQWIKSNPSDASKWAKFRDDVLAGKQVVPPTMATKYGQALVAAGKEHMSISRLIGSPTPPLPPSPAPPSGSLPWRPPGWDGVNDPSLSTSYPGYTLYTVQEDGSNRSVSMSSGTDYFIDVSEFNFSSQLGLNLVGGRNVVVVGGHIYGDTAGSVIPTPALAIWGATQTVHIEGMSFTGPYIFDAVAIRNGNISNASSIIQFQNCRFESHLPDGYPLSAHPDCVQLQAGGQHGTAWPGTVRFYNCTFNATFQGLFCEYDSGGPVTLENCNMRALPTAWDGTNVATGGYFSQVIREANPVTFVGDTVWADLINGNPIGNAMNPSTAHRYCLNDAEHGSFCTAAAVADKATQHSDALGTYYSWDDPAIRITGKFRQGVPAAGDYCPLGVPGVSYSSPRYV